MVSIKKQKHAKRKGYLGLFFQLTLSNKFENGLGIGEVPRSPYSSGNLMGGDSAYT